MKTNTKCIFILLVSSLSTIHAVVAGKYFWRPRMGRDLPDSTTEGSESPEVTVTTRKPAPEPPYKGYKVGLTVLALAVGISSARTSPHLNPLSAYFYTNAYRWALRHLSLIPIWLAGRGGHYYETHKLWRRRFYFVDEFVPKWLRYLFPYVQRKEWEKEIQEFKRFKKYSEPAFAKHYRYPPKTDKDFNSTETQDGKDSSESRSSSSSKD